ncbi:hypothetical protein BDR22DRAFT_145079 [Usnea florida]
MASSTSPTYLDEPLVPPPPGEHSDIAHPPSRAPDLYIAASICLPLIVIFAALRFYAKMIIKKKKTWDDFTCILGLRSQLYQYISRRYLHSQLLDWRTGSIAYVKSAVSGGTFGLHQWDITDRDFSKEQLLLLLITELIYGPCLWFVKLSLFVLYLEIFGLLRWLRYSVYFGIITTGLFYFATMMVFAITCSPKNGYGQTAYLMGLRSPACSRTRPLIEITGAFSVVSDLYLVILPLPAVWSMQLPLRKKIGVSAMFLTGSVACIASILGLYYRVIEINTDDNTWAVLPTWINSDVEMTAGILVCCMPSTAVVLGHSKERFSYLLAKSRRGFSGFITSFSMSHQEKSDSTSNLRPPYDGSRAQDKVQEQYELQKPRSGPEDVWMRDSGGAEHNSCRFCWGR